MGLRHKENISIFKHSLTLVLSGVHIKLLILPDLNTRPMSSVLHFGTTGLRFSLRSVYSRCHCDCLWFSRFTSLLHFPCQSCPLPLSYLVNP